MKISSFKSLRLIPALALMLGVALAFPAHAGISDQQYSPSDDFNEPSINSNYDLQTIETGFDSDDPDQIYFWLVFKNPVTAKQFVQGRTEPWASILIFRDQPDSLGGDSDDIRISTNTTSGYTGNTSITARAYGNEYAGDVRVSLDDCSPETWTNLDTKANWIGFSISRSCANIPDYFWVVGYVDPDDSNSSSTRDWDYAPSDAWYVDISGSDGGGDSYYTDPQSIYFYQSPDTLLTKKYVNVTAYADSGLDVYFMSLTPKVCKSVNYTEKIQLISVGTCKLSADQDGDDYYDAADTQYMSFKVVKSGTKIKPVPKASPKPTIKPTLKPRVPGSIGGKPKS